MEIETLLNEEIAEEFDHLKGMDVGSDNYKTTVDGITKLVDRAIEMKKLESESKEKVECRKREDDLNQKQMKEERIHRIVTIVLDAAGIIVPTALAIWGTKKSFEFEKEGTITTIMGRGFINKLLPRK